MNKGIIEKATLTDIADAIREKNGAEETYTPGEMAAAIAALPDGSLPALTNPANDYQVRSGKEYIDKNGAKQTGTMPDVAGEIVLCKTQDEKISMCPDASGYVDCDDVFPEVSAASLDANLIAGNVRAGVSIFGVAGACRQITTEHGTWTAPSDTNMAEIPCSEGAKCIVIDAPEAVYSNGTYPANTIFSVCAALIPTDAFVGLDTMFCVAAAVNANGDFQNTMGKITRSNGISIGASSMMIKYVAGAVYTWTAYYWDN